MKKLILSLLVIFLVSCSTQHKTNRSIKKAQKMTMRDFKSGKIRVDYPSLND